jgi:ferredoxin
VKVRLDQARCQGTGYCVRVAPQVFAIDEKGGPSRVLMETPCPFMYAAALYAEDLCPTNAMIVFQ